MTADTRQVVQYASISIVNSFYGTATNQEGRFELILPLADVDTIKISYVGYQSRYIPLSR